MMVYVWLFKRANSKFTYFLVHYKWFLPCGCLYRRGGGLSLVITIGLSGIDDTAGKKEVVKSVAKINGLHRSMQTYL